MLALGLVLEFELELGVSVMVKVRVSDVCGTKRPDTKMLRNVWKRCEKVKGIRLTVPRRSPSPRRTCHW